MNTILVPTDFSKEASYALDFALKLSAIIPSKILVLHVVQYPVSGYTDEEGNYQPFEDEFARLLDKNIENKMAVFLGENSAKVEPVIDVGNPTTVMANCANDQSVDMVVMGTKGASGIKEFMIGSNVEKMVRLATCPVIAIKGKVEPKNIRKIVFGTNFKDTSQDLMESLLRLQQLLGATVHFVRVNTPNNFTRDQVVQKDINTFVKQFNLHNYKMDIYNDANEEEGLMMYALDIKADLIALGTHGYKGI